MLSVLDVVFDLEEDTKAVILRKKINPKSGDQLKVYIPRIMRGIEMGIPKIQISPVQYRGAFANAPECKPKISSMLREQNYLLGVYQNNSSSRSIVKVVYDEEEEDIVKTYIPGEQEVRCQFMNGKLDQLRLNTDDNMNYLANEFIYDQYMLKGDLGEDVEDDDEDVIEHKTYDNNGDTDDVFTKGSSKTFTKNGVTVTRNAGIGTRIRETR